MAYRLAPWIAVHAASHGSSAHLIRVGADITPVKVIKSPRESSEGGFSMRSAVRNDEKSASADSNEAPDSIEVIIEADAFEMAHP